MAERRQADPGRSADRRQLTEQAGEARGDVADRETGQRADHAQDPAAPDIEEDHRGQCDARHAPFGRADRCSVRSEHRTQAGDAGGHADHQDHQAGNLGREYRPHAVEQRCNRRFQQAGEDRHAEQHRQSAKPHREQRRRKIGGRGRGRTHEASADRANAVHLQEGSDGKRPNDHGEHAGDHLDRGVDRAENQDRIDQIDRDHPDVLDRVEQGDQRRRHVVHRVDEAKRLLAGRAFARILCGAQRAAKYTCEHGVHGLAFDQRGFRLKPASCAARAPTSHAS